MKSWSKRRKITILLLLVILALGGTASWGYSHYIFSTKYRPVSNATEL